MKMIAAIPALDEQDWIFTTLECLAKQNFSEIEVLVCVNQPESWRKDRAKSVICKRNEQLLDMLRRYSGIEIFIIDKASEGHGWEAGRDGVGWARKTLMDQISYCADDDDIIVSLDADTQIPADYFAALNDSFVRHPDAVGLSAPYLHELCDDDDINRMILRYEIYLRYYALNMWRIKSPYCFTALGSGIAVPVWAYRKVGGMVPRKSGEDFYFLQQLAKIGRLLHWTDSCVYPAARISDRVPYGTGQSILKGISEGWGAYPIIRSGFYDDVQGTTESFPVLFTRDSETPMSDFLRSRFKADDPWAPLRKNHTTEDAFVRACHERVDGLRIFQYLRSVNHDEDSSDEENLSEFLDIYYPDAGFDRVDFESSPLNELDELRHFLRSEEAGKRKESDC